MRSTTAIALLLAAATTTAAPEAPIERPPPDMVVGGVIMLAIAYPSHDRGRVERQVPGDDHATRNSPGRRESAIGTRRGMARCPRLL